MNNKTLMIIIIILSIIIVGLLGYIFINSQETKPGNMGNIPITDDAKNKVINFFENSPSLGEAKVYCNENKINCRYFCTEINSNHEICDEIGMGVGKK